MGFEQPGLVGSVPTLNDSMILWNFKIWINLSVSRCYIKKKKVCEKLFVLIERA